MLGQGDGLAGRPWQIGDRHFRKSELGPGIFAERLEKRKIAREVRREKALAAAEDEDPAKVNKGKGAEADVDAAENPNAVERSTVRSESSDKGREVRSIKSDGRNVRIKRRGTGHGGKGTGPATRRRVVLKPLFGN